MRHIKYILLIFIFPLSIAAQPKVTMTMEECIRLASQQSLEAFLAKNTYLVSYWDNRSYKASKLPSLDLESTPFSFYNGITQNWDSEDDIYVTSQTKRLQSSAELQLNQQITLTGGTLSLTTGNSLLNNYVTEPTYTSDVVSIKYTQKLNGYNSFRWESKINPLEFESAKKAYIEEREDIAIQAIQKFFDLAQAQITLDISERNLDNAEELYKIGTGRFEVGTITQDELLSLELDLYNSQLAKVKAEQNLVRKRTSLNIFLNIDRNTIIECIIPEDISPIEIPVSKALEKAIENSPTVKNLDINLLKSEQNLSQVKANNRFSSTLNLSYGLNGNNEDFVSSYDNLGDKQSANLSFNIPIIDWGEGKGNVSVAQAQLEAQKISKQKALIQFEENVTNTTLEFNLQKRQVENSAKADTIAQKGYQISYEIFKLGKLDVIKLNQARTSQVQAREDYISALKSYWVYWYTIRQLTLYDFENDVALTEDFDALINK